VSNFGNWQPDDFDLLGPEAGEEASDGALHDFWALDPKEIKAMEKAFGKGERPADSEDLDDDGMPRKKATGAEQVETPGDADTEKF
jgi:hypothetical protein